MKQPTWLFRKKKSYKKRNANVKKKIFEEIFVLPRFVLSCVASYFDFKQQIQNCL